MSERNLVWRDSKLYFDNRVVAEIVADEKHRGMWRVVRPDGSLSDMTNRTRAKDACAAAFFGTDRQTEGATGDFSPPLVPDEAPAEINDERMADLQ